MLYKCCFIWRVVKKFEVSRNTLILNLLMNLFKIDDRMLSYKIPNDYQYERILRFFVRYYLCTVHLTKILLVSIVKG